MDIQGSINSRRLMLVLNYLCLLTMNVCFYFAWAYQDMNHVIDALGIGSLLIVVATFFQLFLRTGLWRLTHTDTDSLDEREIEITHEALRYSYSWFSIVCLVIIFTHAVVYRLVPDVDFAISVPLAGSLLYLAHTLPGAVLAWREKEMPGALL